MAQTRHNRAPNHDHVSHPVGPDTTPLPLPPPQRRRPVNVVEQGNVRTGGPDWFERGWGGVKRTAVWKAQKPSCPCKVMNPTLPLPSTHMALLVPGQDVPIPCVVAAKPVGMGDIRSGWKRGGEEVGRGGRTTSRLLIDRVRRQGDP